MDILHPKTNYAGWPGNQMLEYPLFQALAAWTAKLNGNPLTATRWLNIMFGTLSLVIAYWIAKGFFNSRTVSQYAVILLAFSPLGLRYHPSALVDVFGATLSLASFLLFTKYIKSNNIVVLYLFISISAVALVIKPLFYFPIALYYILHVIDSIPSRSWSNIKRAMLGHLKVPNLVFILLLIILAGWIHVAKQYDVSKIDQLDLITDFSALINPGYYLGLAHRLVFMYVNPIGALLFLIGSIWVWQVWRLAPQAALVWSAPLFLLLFPFINRPHDYYSLAVTPYVAIVAGYGAMRIEQQVFADSSQKAKHLFRAALFILMIITSIMFYIVNNVTSSANLDSPYRAVSQELSPILTPYSHSVVYLNTSADYPIGIHLLHDRKQHVLYRLGIRSAEQIKARPPTYILNAPQLLYGIKQYGHVSRIAEQELKVDAERMQSLYQGHLRYVLFYRYDPTTVEREMRGLQLIHRSKAWMVYDL
ncbi:MAG: glycosyltransferase family 39 protein, partial [Magnetococcales bacterium]|nr:glycosyltransferase family 39 protein [Magnetococcales bacterium]